MLLLTGDQWMRLRPRWLYVARRGREALGFCWSPSHRARRSSVQRRGLRDGKLLRYGRAERRDHHQAAVACLALGAVSAARVVAVGIALARRARRRPGLDSPVV